MARLTHLTLRSNRGRVLRAGLRASRGGVHAMPVLPDFFVSHQWLRELRRRGPQPLVAVDFVVPDDEPVLVGHYAEPHVGTSAAEAAGVIMHADDARGYELLVPRAIVPKEIARVRSVPQVVGWRYTPDSHGRAPCPCRFCTGGQYGAARTRDRLGYVEPETADARPSFVLPRDRPLRPPSVGGGA